MRKMMLAFAVAALLAPSCVAQERAIHAALERGPSTDIVVGESHIRLVTPSGDLTLPARVLSDWVKSDADLVAAYFGRFPVSKLGLLLTPVSGKGIGSGVTFGGEEPVMRVGVGQDADAAALARDWVLVHEMVHLGLPLLPQRHHWLEEGVATYVEPIARAQAGQLSEERVWGDMLRDMHQGLPKDGDQGLDHTPTWGRTYWGGALFCLLAEVRLRERTDNRYGLQQALRAIARESGGIAHSRSILEVLRIGDAATGTQVLTELYAEMADKPVSPDLAQLWQRLGVSLVDGKLRFDDSAPLAKLRRAITQKAGN